MPEEPTFTCELNDEVGVTEYKIQLMGSKQLGSWSPESNSSLSEIWRWKRSDGAWVSPLFTSKEAAHYFAGKIPYLSDAEWKEYNPLPEYPPNNICQKTY